jgi:uncharacterized protein with beta-barrel porin domain
MDGGTGADRIRNEGDLDVTLESTLTTTGGSNAIFGNASDDTALSALARGFGVIGGEGADTIENVDSLVVRSTSTLTSSKTAASFAGGATTGLQLSSTAQSTGIDAGSEGDTVRNDGELRLAATANAVVNGASAADLGGNTAAKGDAASSATVLGIEGGAGDNLVTNTGAVALVSNADSQITNDSNSGLFFSSANTTAGSEGAAQAVGLAAADGHNELRNQGTIAAQSDAVAYGFSYATGAEGSFIWGGNGAASSTALALGIAKGLSAGDGTNLIVNDGSMAAVALASTVKTLTKTTRTCQRVLEDVETCTVDPDTEEETCTTTQELVDRCEEQEVLLESHSTFAGANGNGATGDGTASATATADAEAYGIDVGHGANTIINTGHLSATASPDARATAVADGDLGGNATSAATATALASAVAIRAGDGNNLIENDGTITAAAEPMAQAVANASGGDICIWYIFGTWCGSGGTGRGTATAAFTAEAVGISAGDGNNVIINKGTILATAAPQIAPDVEVRDNQWETVTARVINADQGTTSTQVNATAIGIRTGNGDNAIENAASGLIEVVSQDVAQCTGGGCGTPSLQAVGILTGSGNDLIINNGQIRTSVEPRGSEAAAGVAIDSGPGSDTVILGAGSSATGDVRLGAGNDTLVWISTADLTGHALAGEGERDLFVLGGALDDEFELSRVGVTFQEFDEYHKRGSSTWTLVGDRAIDWTVDEGTLAVRNTVTGTIQTSAGAVNAHIAINRGATLGRNDNLAPAALLNGGTTLTNEGLVSIEIVGATAIETHGAGNLLVNSGMVRGGVLGVLLDGAGNLFDNRASVFGWETGVRIEGTGNTLVNAGIIGGSSGSGVVLAGHGNTVSNRGEIRSHVGPAVRFGSPAGQTEHFLNDTDGYVFSLFGVAIQGGEGDDHVENYGEVVGNCGAAISLAGGSDELLIGGSSKTCGRATGGEGTDTFVLGGIEDARFDLGDIGPVYQEFELFHKRGSSTWTLFGTAAKDWMVEGGTLAIEGGVHGTVSTAAGALETPRIDIRATGYVSRDDGLPVIALAGGATLTNEGLIVSGVGGIGVEALGVGNAITNRGEITSGGLGVQVTGDANVLVNAGSVRSGNVGVETDGTGNLFLNTGDVSGRVGVRLKGHAASLVNEGGVFGTRTGVSMDADGGTIVNAGLITSKDVAVTIAGDGVTLTNVGQITADGSAVRFHTAANEAATIVNGGGAVIRSAGGLAIEGGAGAERLENHGTISSGADTAIDFGAGDDELLMTTGATLRGVAVGGAGSDSLELAGPGGARLDLSTFHEFELLEKTGSGAWLLDGSSEMDWNLAQGTLIVEGTLSGDGLVGATGLLMGNGSVGGFVNAGTVAPGASIGTLTVLGDYEHALGATLEIEGAITGWSDRLEVTGEARLNGGTVQVLPESRPYGIATEYTILNAAAGISGTFDTVSSSLAYLDPSLDYDATTVLLTLVRNDISFAGMANQPNLVALGTALDANKKAMAKGDFKGVMDQFVTMDEAERTAALFSLTGELHATTSRALLHTGERFFAASVDRQLSARAIQGERTTVWTDAFGFTGRVDGDGNAGAARYRAAGFALGMDLMIGDSSRLGAAFGVSPGSSELDTLGGGSADIRSYHPAIYGDHRLGRWAFGGGMGYSRHNVETARDVRFGAVARRAGADYHADQYSGLVHTGFDVRRTGSLALQAIGELWYSRLTRDGFTESGAESAGLTEVSDARSESLRSVIGLRASWTPNFWGMRMRPEMEVAWAHETLDTRGEFTASLTGALGSAGWARFTIRGVREARDSALVTLGTTTDFAKSGQAFIAYDGSLASTGAAHGLAAGLRWSW